MRDTAARARDRQALVTGIDFRQADAEDLPFADSSFDAVVGNLILNHLSRPEVGVNEIARVLTTGGRVALSVWDSDLSLR